MKQEVFGNLELVVSIPVKSRNESYALLEANLALHPDTVIDWRLIAIDCNGHEHKIRVHNCNKTKLDELVILD